MSDRETSSSGEIETGTAGRACEACHKKKTKCDMQQPMCGLCRRTNKDCHYPTTRKRPSRQEPSVRAKLQKVNGNLDRLVELLEKNPGLEHESLEGILDAKTGNRGTHSTIKGEESAHDATLTSLPCSDIPKKLTSQSPADISSWFPVSHELAVDLIDTFFHNIQPWLPLFHKPSFLQWANTLLTPGDNALSAMSLSELALFNGMFCLSARFSEHTSLANIQPRERGEIFMKVTEEWFRMVRDTEEFDLTFLKACVLLAYYHYGSGCSRRGWYITHMCTRGCYELGLHQIDEGDDGQDDQCWVEKESLRRTFWAIWELDSFGSIVKRKPFSIDYRHIEVKMPVSDDAWFAGRKIESSKFISGPDCWRTLVGSPNQDERAWIILSKAILAHVFDLMLYKDGVTSEQLSTVESSISCFKLAMPESLQVNSPTWSAAGFKPARKNWLVAPALYLATGTFILTRMPILGQLPSPKEETQYKDLASYSSRVLELNEILKRWPADSIPYAHPCLACTILTYDESLVNMLPPSPAVNTYRDLSGLILAKIAERWQLGAVLLRVRDLAYNFSISDEETRAELMRQYPVYFDREIKRNRKPIVEEANRMWTPSASSPSLSSITTRRSTDQSNSPEQISQHQIQQQQHHQPIDSQHQIPTYSTSGPMDHMYNPQLNNFQDYGACGNLNQSPEDIDALFSGFLQEPWWQDFGAVNFVV